MLENIANNLPSPEELGLPPNGKPEKPSAIKKKTSAENGRLYGGRPKGSMNKQTKEIKSANELYREIMMAELRPLIKAKLALALGYYKAVTIGKGAKKKVVDAYLTDPSGGNIEDIFNRIMGKPKDGAMDDISKSIAEVGSAMRQILSSKKK